MVLAELQRAGPYGRTCRDIARRLSMSPNQVATRMMELRELGLAVRLKERRTTTVGATGHVHIAADYRPHDESLVMPEPNAADPIEAARNALVSVGWADGMARSILRVLDLSGLTVVWKR